MKLEVKVDIYETLSLSSTRHLLEKFFSFTIHLADLLKLERSVFWDTIEQDIGGNGPFFEDIAYVVMKKSPPPIRNILHFEFAMKCLSYFGNTPPVAESTYNLATLYNEFILTGQVDPTSIRNGDFIYLIEDFGGLNPAVKEFVL